MTYYIYILVLLATTSFSNSFVRVQYRLRMASSFSVWQLEFGRKLMAAKASFLSNFDPATYNGL